MKRLVLLAAVLLAIALSSSFSATYKIEHTKMFSPSSLAELTSFEFYGGKFYMINNFDGKIYLFDSLGGLSNVIKTDAVYAYDIEGHGDELIYVSNSNISRIRPNKEVVAFIYGITDFDFNDNYFVGGTLYNSVSLYNRDFKLLAKTPGYPSPEQMAVKDVMIYRDNIVVADSLNGSIKVFNTSLSLLYACPINATAFAVYENNWIVATESKVMIIDPENCGALGTTDLAGIVEIEDYNGDDKKIYAVSPDTLYSVSVTEQEEAPPETPGNQTANETQPGQQPEQNATPPVVTPPRAKPPEADWGQIIIIAVATIALIVILAGIYLYLKMNERYKYKRREK